MSITIKYHKIDNTINNMYSKNLITTALSYTLYLIVNQIIKKIEFKKVSL
jgi:hypothetical protein